MWKAFKRVWGKLVTGKRWVHVGHRGRWSLEVFCSFRSLRNAVLLLGAEWYCDPVLVLVTVHLVIVQIEFQFDAVAAAVDLRGGKDA